MLDQDALILFGVLPSISDEAHWDDLVELTGGARLSPLINRPNVKNADYIFHQFETIAELKVLEEELTDHEGFSNKIRDALDKSRYADNSEEAEIRRVSQILRAKIKDNLVVKANKQIKETKKRTKIW